jgi:hypothetical protein
VTALSPAPSSGRAHRSRRCRSWRSTAREPERWSFSPRPPPFSPAQRNYAGSVAISDDCRRAAITAPRGGLMLTFDLDHPHDVRIQEAADVCGAAPGENGFVFTTGGGAFRSGNGAITQTILAFDNNVVRLG